MRNKIEKPKVFISYAWASDEYQKKVLSFASSLMDDGIDVLFDKWDLREGNDTYAFMEKSVTDPTVTNVLILLDPVYEEKANERQGGVGTETQIISAEIYNKTEQTKFLPIIFEKKSDGGVPKPVYLGQTLHFDLTKAENYDEEYQRLVKRLYGVEVYRKPEIGNKPAWVDEEIDISVSKRITKLNEIKNIQSENDRSLFFKENVNDIKKIFLNYAFSDKSADIISMYDELQDIKRDYLSLMEMIPYTPKSINTLAESFEEIYLKEKMNMNDSAVKLSLLHELFIYLVAICYKNELFKELGYLLKRSYYSGNYDDDIENFKIFYHSSVALNTMICKRDNKNYLSGTAEYWMEKINIDVCSKDEFVFADVLCYNVSIFSNPDNRIKYWFPLTYVYKGNKEFNSNFMRFSKGLKSKEKLDKAALIFGFDETDGFIERFKKIRSDQYVMEEISNIRFSEYYNGPETLFRYINPDELGVKY